MRKYTTNSPDLNNHKENKHIGRESIEKFDSICLKLPSINSSHKRSPLLSPFNDIHSKSLSPLKMRQGKIYVEKEKQYDHSKMYLPSIFSIFFFIIIHKFSSKEIKKNF